ncbi:hypothetical protein SGPA1_50849 [Streptomyces misionensis JCM 4497]
MGVPPRERSRAWGSRRPTTTPQMCVPDPATPTRSGRQALARRAGATAAHPRDLRWPLPSHDPGRTGDGPGKEQTAGPLPGTAGTPPIPLPPSYDPYRKATRSPEREPLPRTAPRRPTEPRAPGRHDLPQLAM